MRAWASLGFCVAMGLMGPAWGRGHRAQKAREPNHPATPAPRTLHRILLSSFVLPPKKNSVGKLRRPDADGIVSTGARVAVSFADSSHCRVGDILVSYVRGGKVASPHGHPPIGRLGQISGILVVEQVAGHAGMVRVLEPLTEIEPGHDMLPIAEVLPDQAEPAAQVSRQEQTYDQPLRRNIVVHPAEKKIVGQVVEVERQALVAGYQRLVFIDKGRADGLTLGDTLTLRPQPKSRKGMPDLTLGEAVVVSLGEQFATCWMTLAHLEIGAGDHFVTQLAAPTQP